MPAKTPFEKNMEPVAWVLEPVGMFRSRRVNGRLSHTKLHRSRTDAAAPRDATVPLLVDKDSVENCSTCGLPIGRVLSLIFEMVSKSRFLAEDAGFGAAVMLSSTTRPESRSC